MVKLEISALTDEFSPEFDEVCEYLQGQDVGYVELRKVWVGSILEVDDQTLGDARDILRDCGLKVSGIAGPLLKCLPPSVNPEPKQKTNYTENWQYNYSLIDHALDVAEYFDCPYLRCFAYQGDFPVKPPTEWDDWEVWQDWARAARDLRSKASGRGKTLTCENDSGFCTRIEEAIAVGRHMAGPGFGVLLDPGNIARSYGSAGVLTPETLTELAPYTQYIHAKDVVEDPSGKRAFTHVNAPGAICNFPAIFAHFQGMPAGDFVAPPPDPLFVSIETHMGKDTAWADSVQNLRNLKALL